MDDLDEQIKELQQGNFGGMEEDDVGSNPMEEGNAGKRSLEQSNQQGPKEEVKQGWFKSNFGSGSLN